jgi:Protein of unknown function (DUF4232)
MPRLAAVALFVCLGAVPAAGASAQQAARLCRGSMLTGSFTVIAGSAGAGNVAYRLRIRNSSAAECGVTGIPGLSLLDAHDHPLPTRALATGAPGSLTAVLVSLRPGGSATLSARFSPDVPGPGEPITGRPCERTAAKLRVSPAGSGLLIVAVSPPTPVCEHGSLQLTAFAAA